MPVHSLCCLLSRHLFCNYTFQKGICIRVSSWTRQSWVDDCRPIRRTRWLLMWFAACLFSLFLSNQMDGIIRARNNMADSHSKWRRVIFIIKILFSLSGPMWHHTTALDINWISSWIGGIFMGKRNISTRQYISSQSIFPALYRF